MPAERKDTPGVEAGISARHTQSRRAIIGSGLALGIIAAARGLGISAAPPKETGLSFEGLLKGKPGFQPRKPAPLVEREIPGFLSRRQLEQNYAVYREAFDRLIGAERILARVSRDASHSADYASMRAQQLEAANSVLLHEFYFRNLAVRPVEPSQYLRDNMTEHMGSMESWREDFSACGRVARSWAVLAYDPYDDRWHNVALGDHDAGGWVGANPLVVCDVAPHAYNIDYTVRDKYIDGFIRHLDWKVVRARYHAVDRH